MSERVDKASLPLNQPRRTPSHPTKSHIVKTKVDGKEKILRFGEQGASTAGKPKAGESERMKAKRASFKARHAKNIAKGKSSPAYWANKVKWAEGGAVSLDQLSEKYDDGGSVDPSMLRRLKNTLGSAASDVNRSFYENVSGPAVGSLVDMTVGLGDLAQMGAKYLGNRMGYDAGEFTPVAPRVKQALGVDNYNPYTVGGVAANLLPFARGEQALSAAATGLPRLFFRLFPNLGREAAAYGGSEAAAAGAREFMPDSPLVELAASAAGGSAAGGFGGSASQSPTVSNMAVKNKGGNWLDKSVAEEIAALQAPNSARFDRVSQINRWLETKLNSYIRNDMGTPEDPVRELAERGTLHFEPQQRGPQAMEELRLIREMEGLPGAGFGQSELARRWETATDTSIAPGQARNYVAFRNGKGELTTEKYPWLLKVPPETKVYDTAADNNMRTLGFNHLVDELRNATRPGTDLPERLRIDYNKLDKMTVPQIVEKVADINTWRAQEAVRAEREGMMANLQGAPRVEAPELSLSFVERPGGKWVDIPETVDETGLKLCTSIGKAGGWCTQGEGLAKSYGSGDNRLTALVDAEGRPHAQAKISTVRVNAENTQMGGMLDEQEAIEDQLLMNAATVLQERGLGDLFGEQVEVDVLAEALGGNNPRGLSREARDALDEVYAEAERRLPKTELPVPDITELKPPGNSFNSDRAREYARRDPQYKQKVTDSVLRFLNDGNWGKVADLDQYVVVDL